MIPPWEGNTQDQPEATTQIVCVVGRLVQIDKPWESKPTIPQ